MIFSLVLCFILILNSNTTHLHISRRLHSISQIPTFLPKMALGLANLVLSKSVSMCRFRKFFLEIVHRHIIDFSSFFFILILNSNTANPDAYIVFPKSHLSCPKMASGLANVALSKSGLMRKFFLEIVHKKIITY